MKKFKTCKEILENPHFRTLAFQLIQEMQILNDEEVESKVDFFIRRKIKQCVMEGV